MYQIYADYDATGTWEHLYWQGDDDYAAFGVECSLLIGDSGSLSLSVPKTNPGYSRVRTRKTLLDFRQDGRTLGTFEVREIGRDMEGTAELYAVGELSWLLDSTQPQAEYHDLTSRQFLSRLLATHNEQCPDHPFQIGIVNVTDSNDSLYRYTNREKTLDAIRDKLVDRLGGNLRVRRAGTTRYLDYVSDETYGTEAEQTVRFGENILDYTDGLDVSDICTELIPLGARLENDAGDNSSIGNLERRTTIESVNGGLDYITNPKLIERFGHIRATHTWDDVAVPSNLLSKARAWLDGEQYERMSISVRAVDLSMTDAQFGALRMGDYAYVVCEPFGLKARYLIRSRTYHPDDPTKDSVELGDSKRSGSYVASSSRRTRAAASALAESSHEHNEWLKSSIENVTAMMTGARGGYKFTEYDSDGRWLADYIMDSMDRETARIVRKVTVDGTAYSTNGVGGPYETAIMANGTILGKYIEAGGIKAEQISSDYTKMWQDADDDTLVTARTEFEAADAQISASVTANKEDADGKIEALSSRVKITEKGISTSVQKGAIGSAINQSAEKINIKADKFGWESTNSSMSTDGILKAKKAVLESAQITGRFIAGDVNGMRVDVSEHRINLYGRKNNYIGTLGPTRLSSYFGIEANNILAISAKKVLVGITRYTPTGDEAVPEDEYHTGYTGNVTYKDGGGNNRRMRFINGFMIDPNY